MNTAKYDELPWKPTADMEWQDLQFNYSLRRKAGDFAVAQRLADLMVSKFGMSAIDEVGAEPVQPVLMTPERTQIINDAIKDAVLALPDGTDRQLFRWIEDNRFPSFPLDVKEAIRQHGLKSMLHEFARERGHHPDAIASRNVANNQPLTRKEGRTLQ